MQRCGVLKCIGEKESRQKYNSKQNLYRAKKLSNYYMHTMHSYRWCMHYMNNYKSHCGYNQSPSIYPQPQRCRMLFCNMPPKRLPITPMISHTYTHSLMPGMCTSLLVCVDCVMIACVLCEERGPVPIPSAYLLIPTQGTPVI